MAKLERAIAGSKAKIRQLDCEVEDLCKATETLRAVSDEFNSETKDIISSLHLCPKEISSTVAKIYAQVKLRNL